MSEPALFDLHADGEATWIHAEGRCIARYGRQAFEVYSQDDPQTLLRHGRTTGAPSWLAFAEGVRDVHGYAVPANAAPDHLHAALGVTPPEPVEVPLALLDEWNPLERNPWLRDPCDRPAIAAALALGQTEPDFVPMPLRDLALPTGWDARRVAHLVLHPDPTPIDILVTSTHGHIEIDDGWHRLCAAFYRGDATIPALIQGEPLGRELAFPAAQCRPVAPTPERSAR